MNFDDFARHSDIGRSRAQTISSSSCECDDFNEHFRGSGVCTPISEVDSVDNINWRGGGTNNLLDVHLVLAIDLSAYNYVLFTSSSVPL